MMRNALTRRGVLVASLLGMAAGAAQQDADGYLHDRVHRKLNSHAFLRIRQLVVEVADGVVTIRGVVRSKKVKARAAKVASIKGVKRVVNLLTVSG